jgi:predicted nucleic acid-binding protein
MAAANRGGGFGKTGITETTSDGGLTEMSLDPPLLLDASIWVAAHDVDDRFYDNSRELAFDNALNAAALDLTLFEVANVVAKRWGGFSVAIELSRSVVKRCAENFVTVDSQLIEATIGIAAEYRLTSYDAAYVAVARRYDWTLVSTDIRDLVSKGLAITPDAAV